MQDEEGRQEGQGCDHGPVSIAQARLAVEAGPDAGEEAAEDQGKNADVIKP